MKLTPIMLRCGNGLWQQCHSAHVVRAFSTKFGSVEVEKDGRSSNSFESADDFERRIFSGINDNSPSTDSFYQTLDKLEKAHRKNDGASRTNGNDDSAFLDGLYDSFSTLSDNMDGKLKEAARYFAFSDEMYDNDYAYRPDVSFRPGMQYDVKDLDLTKPAVQKSFKRPEFEVTTEEVLKKADFRNVRFLANFITEAGIIIKRSKTGISAKAQRQVAREIKTARAFGLMPFTTMGTKAFVFGKSMEDRDEDYEFDDNRNRRFGQMEEYKEEIVDPIDRTEE